jgi:quercetin dioxygenase-like cupin family protein
MKIINIYSKNDGLEIHRDERGIIADVFYGANLNHVAIIESQPGAIRGNHYHAVSTQHMLITKGSLEYWYRDKDLITSPPNEVHALRITSSGCEFLAFTSGPRGGSDYESDTFRVPSIMGPQIS